MNEEDKKQFVEDFRKADGAKRLDLWDFAIKQEVLWDQLLTEMTTIAREQGVDKELDKRLEEDMKKTQ